MMNRKIAIIFSILYTISFIGGIIYNHFNNTLLNKLIIYILDYILSIGFLLILPTIERLLKVSIGSLLKVLTAIFILMAVYLGDMFDFYDLIPSWDLILHSSSGVLFTFIAFIVIRNVLCVDVSPKKTFWFSLIGAMLISFSIAFIWEILEFTGDSLVGNNAQRFIPEVEGIYSTGNTHDALWGDKDFIYNFFTSPEGYRYALMDTMLDMIVCFVGTVLTGVCLFVAYKKVKLASLDNLLIYHKIKNEALNDFK